MSANEQKIIRCRYCGSVLLSDGKICPNCGQRKQFPLFLQGEFWALLVSIALSVTAFATVLYKIR